MVRALVFKELRELVGGLGLGLLALLFVVANETGFNLLPVRRAWSYAYYVQGELPFSSNSFSFTYSLICIGFFLAFALRQTLGEAYRGTTLYLLHRPMPRRQIFLTKLLTGLVLCWAMSALPLLLYTFWALTPGTHPSPFFLWVTGPVWKLWVLLPMFYLSGFLVGIRPVHWLGTRVFPLAATSMLFFLLYQLPWWFAWLPLTVLVYWLHLVLIEAVTQARDYP